MTLFLDCEFNGFGSNELISIALVSDQTGPDREFYAVAPIPDRLEPWVAENVIPKLDRAPETIATIKTRLVQFLRAHADEPIVADWPEDFVHLLSLLTVAGGRWHAMQLSMKLIDGLEIKSRRSHNALSDARGLMRAYNRRPT